MEETSSGELLCIRGGRLSRSMTDDLSTLVRAHARDPETRAVAGFGRAPWCCPRCAVGMVTDGRETFCPGCGLDLTRSIHPLTETNPHVPAPVAPDALRTFLELHDSHLESVDEAGFYLDMFVHRWTSRAGQWEGIGWWQMFRFDFAECVASPIVSQLSEAIADGTFVIGDEVHDNGIAYPLDRRGPTTVTLILATAEHVVLRGHFFGARAVGEAVFGEHLDDAFAPPTV